MQLGIDEASCLYAGWPIRVSAQKHLQAFYESLGFTVRGDPYDEDGIPHVGMIRPSSPTPRTG
jgi:ElaA protein